ncbi:MAG: hypothetical protein AAF351_07815 [Pseudomonadota bacterium]
MATSVAAMSAVDATPKNMQIIKIVCSTQILLRFGASALYPAGLRLIPQLRARQDKLLLNALHQLHFTVTMHRMPKTKISTLNLRISPSVKTAVRQAAAQEHRSVANMVEMLIRRHCENAGIAISDVVETPSRNDNG